MLSLPKHLYRFIAKPFNGAVEMLRQAQHDGRWAVNTHNLNTKQVFELRQQPFLGPDFLFFFK